MTARDGVALSMRGVTQVLGDGETQVTALDAVDLEIRHGEFVAVVGPSGSGKSTLLAVAGALVTATSGEVVVRGVDLTAQSRKGMTRVRRDHVGYVFQQSNLLPSLTAKEQLLMSAHLRGRVGAEQKSRADDLLESVGMAARADRRPHQLSGGERQRVGIARALMNDPAVLLVDEPTSALDHVRGAEIVELLAKQTHDRGTATLMVTHDTGILDTADRVLVMRDGRLGERD